MALTPSTMLPLGTIAPDFQLPDTISSEIKSLQELKSPTATVIMFICNHCPYVIHMREQIVHVAQQYQKQNVSFIAINSNDIEKYPDDSPEKMRQLAQQLNFTFPYLFDESQEVARKYHAACTPDFYLFDKDLRCVYRGQFDDSRPGSNIPVTGNSLTQAIDNLITGKPINEEQKPSVGCNIKWKTL